MTRILVYMGGTYTVLARGNQAELEKILEQIAEEVHITKQGMDFIVIPKVSYNKRSA